MPKLLYLEDNGYLLKQTLRFLKEDGYEVIPFTRIDQAIEYLNNNPNGDGIDCIITDLNMDDKWLGEYRSESNGGLLSGWVWLMRFVYIREEYRNTPCIIYSGYISDLESFLQVRSMGKLLRTYPVSCVRKGGNNNNGYGALVERLEWIFRKNREERII